MYATVEQLAQILIFIDLNPSELERLIPYTKVQHFMTGEIIMQEGTHLPARLYALLSGNLQIVKTSTTGKETILRNIPSGEIFAAPALLGNGIAPAMVSAIDNSIIVTVEREALLETIQQTPEIALRMLMVFYSRLQQMHDTVHGLVSERAIVRMARLIQYSATRYGTELTKQGTCLKTKLSYYQIARSIGITYEECVRLFKRLKAVVAYSRGGQITVLNAGELEAIANGTLELDT